MTKNRKQKLRYDLSFLGLMVFIVINVWLSLVIKKLKNETAEQAMLVNRERAEVLSLDYHIRAFKNVFCMNIGLNDTRLTEPLVNDLHNLMPDRSDVLLLYLKADACSSCNLQIISWLVKRGIELDDFRIVAHTSNTAYLEEMHREGIIADTSLILWYDDGAYDEPISESTADLLFIDNENVIQALFALDFIKDVCLFDEYLQCVDAAIKRFQHMPIPDP